MPASLDAALPRRSATTADILGFAAKLPKPPPSLAGTDLQNWWDGARAMAEALSNCPRDAVFMRDHAVDEFEKAALTVLAPLPCRDQYRG